MTGCKKHTQTCTHSLPTRSHRHCRLLVRESLLTRLHRQLVTSYTDGWSPVRETETHTYSPAYKTDGWSLVRETETHSLPTRQHRQLDTCEGNINTHIFSLPAYKTDGWSPVRETETHTLTHSLPTNPHRWLVSEGNRKTHS